MHRTQIRGMPGSSEAPRHALLLARRQQTGIQGSCSAPTRQGRRPEGWGNGLTAPLHDNRSKQS